LEKVIEFKNMSLRAVLTLNEMKGKELKPSTLEILHFVQNDTSCQIASPQCLFAPRNTKYFRDFSP